MLAAAREIERLRGASGAKSRATRIYFVQHETDGPIKIGLADDPVRRLAWLQSGNPFELIPLGSIPAPAGFERYLHERFASARGRGEWFDPTAELLSLIDGLSEGYRDEYDEVQGFLS